jgi:hypothetical protein
VRSGCVLVRNGANDGNESMVAPGVFPTHGFIVPTLYI